MLDLTDIEKPVPVDNAGPGDFDANGKRYLVGLDRDELANVFRELGEPEKSLRMRANQLWHWLYHRGTQDFEDMTTIAKGLRARLAEVATLDRGAIESHQQSEDGTAKWLVRNADGALIESVYIPEEDRATVRTRLIEDHGCVPIFLDKAVVNGYYHGFSNDILWPLFHYEPLPCFRPGAEKKFDVKQWDAYRRANEIFANAVNDILDENDECWIHITI